jgi:predicted dehydrogenase
MAVCDLNRESAEEVASRLRFHRTYTDLEVMLEQEALDALIAVTPTRATAAVSMRLMETGIPLLMEKPLGTSLAQAEKVVAKARTTACPVTVGLNRRFDPVLVEAMRWARGREVRSFMVRLHRRGRTEEGFIEDVLPHPLDFLQHHLGPFEIRMVIPHGPGNGEAFSALLKSANGANGLLECLPHSAKWRETYAFHGPGFQVEARSLEGCDGFAEDGSAFHFERPEGVPGNPTYRETAAFLEGVRAGKLPGPHPAEVLEAMRRAASIAAQWGR